MHKVLRHTQFYTINYQRGFNEVHEIIKYKFTNRNEKFSTPNQDIVPQFDSYQLKYSTRSWKIIFYNKIYYEIPDDSNRVHTVNRKLQTQSGNSVQILT